MRAETYHRVFESPDVEMCMGNVVCSFLIEDLIDIQIAARLLPLSQQGPKDVTANITVVLVFSSHPGI